MTLPCAQFKSQYKFNLPALCIIAVYDDELWLAVIKLETCVVNIVDKWIWLYVSSIYINSFLRHVNNSYWKIFVEFCDERQQEIVISKSIYGKKI